MPYRRILGMITRSSDVVLPTWRECPRVGFGNRDFVRRGTFEGASPTVVRLHLGKPDLLILDELGYVTAGKVGAELLFDVIATAFER